MLPKAGDCILVAYRHGNLIQEGICAFEKGRFAHVLCSLGGYEIIEADAEGVRWTDLRDYLIRKDCGLKIRRIPELTKEKATKMVKYWKNQVGASYSYLGDVRLGFMLLLRLIGLHRIGQHLPDWFESSHSRFCSQLWVAGAQAARAFPLRYDSFDFSPERLAHDGKLKDALIVWGIL